MVWQQLKKTEMKFYQFKGRNVIVPAYSNAKYFNNSGICVVEKDKKWFYINKKGEELKMPASDKVYDFEDGVAFIKVNDKVGLINPKGEIIVQPTYQVIKSFEKVFW